MTTRESEIQNLKLAMNRTQEAIDRAHETLRKLGEKYQRQKGELWYQRLMRRLDQIDAENRLRFESKSQPK